MQTLGFAYAMLPALRRLYPNGDELTSRINLHLEYFNTQPYLASFILGAAVRLEEGRASGRNRDADVRGMKAALMAALGALGDSFFWGALKPFAVAAAVAVFLAGLWWAPLVFLVIYNIWHVGLRVWLLFLGYESGGDAVSLVAAFNFTKLARNLKIMSLSLLGGILGMLPLWRTEFRLPVPACQTHVWPGRCLRCPGLFRSRLMIKKELLIENRLGLHARAAAQIVKSASAFASKITLSKDGLEVDGKSIMGIMMLAAAKGSSVLLQVEGADENGALAELERLFQDKFGEKE